MDERVLNIRDFKDPTNKFRYRLPEDAVRIDRQSRYGNPYVIGARVTYHKDGTRERYADPLTREQSIALFAFRLVGMLASAPDFLDPLIGKRVACWCAPLACHGEVILQALDRRVAYLARTA